MSKPHEDFYARFIKFTIWSCVVVTILIGTFVVLFN